MNYIKILIAIMVIAGMTSCKENNSEKSSDCNILTFNVGDSEWYVTAGSVTCIYPKSQPETDMIPVIEISQKAVITPKSGEAQNFFTETGVTYTVTAEDGTQKKYVAKASRQ